MNEDLRPFESDDQLDQPLRPSELDDAWLKKARKKEKTKSLTYAGESTEDDDDKLKSARKKNKLFRNFSKHGGKEKEKKKEKERKRSKNSIVDEEMLSIFGTPLILVTEKSRLRDTALPQIVRDCVDAVEKNGLNVNGIYRADVPKSKVDALKDMYDHNRVSPGGLVNQDVHVVAALFKVFLKELPDHLFGNLLPSFEEAASTMDASGFARTCEKLLLQLPEENTTLLRWIFTHFSHVISNGSQNGMKSTLIVQYLSTTLKAKPFFVQAALQSPAFLLSSVEYSSASEVPRATRLAAAGESSEASGRSRTGGGLSPERYNRAMSPPDSPTALRADLRLYEDLLANIHLKMKGPHADKCVEEELWEVQRIVTSYKRKLRTMNAASTVSSKQSEGKTPDEDDSHKSPDPSQPNSNVSESTAQDTSDPDQAMVGSPVASTPAAPVAPAAAAAGEEEMWKSFYAAAVAEMNSHLTNKVDAMRETVASLEKTRDECLKLAEERGLNIVFTSRDESSMSAEESSQLDQLKEENQRLCESMQSEVDSIAKLNADLQLLLWRRKQQLSAPQPDAAEMVPEKSTSPLAEKMETRF